MRSLLLAIEVISPTSVRTDRVTKREYYMNVGVPDYLVVDREARMIERWSPERDTPRVLRDELVWHPSGASEPLIVDVPALFDRCEEKVKRFLGGPRRLG